MAGDRGGHGCGENQTLGMFVAAWAKGRIEVKMAFLSPRLPPDC